ncbi:MAG TPA: hypothetical protein PLV00_05190 [Caldisericia bacterium]|nr:hypothetical protein [Caldisericia bacterium]
MTNNEKKILVIAICAVVLIGIAATLFTTPSTAARKGNGQGKAIASESCVADSDCSVGFKQRGCDEAECTDNPENCSGDCDNCEDGERSYKNRTLEKDTASSSGQRTGIRDGRGCGQSGRTGCDR